MDLNELKIDVEQVDKLQSEINYRKEKIGEICEKIRKQILAASVTTFKDSNAIEYSVTGCLENPYDITDVCFSGRDLAVQGLGEDWFIIPLEYLEGRS